MVVLAGAAAALTTFCSALLEAVVVLLLEEEELEEELLLLLTSWKTGVRVTQALPSLSQLPFSRAFRVSNLTCSPLTKLVVLPPFLYCQPISFLPAGTLPSYRLSVRMVNSSLAVKLFCGAATSSWAPSLSSTYLMVMFFSSTSVFRSA